jgi:pimeloyl-ACP methyl ester carboxylesterase
MAVVHHRYVTVDGHRLFFREAGASDAPAVVLLHGFPTSSYMFRHLIPALAADYRVISPDHLGFGLSDAPSTTDFDYTFDALASLTARFAAQFGNRQVRDVRPGLRGPYRVAAGTCGA